MDIIEKLTEVFKEFPGIGERQAKRFVYFLMLKDGDFINRLSSGIKELKKDVSQCKECFRFFISSDGEKNICDICENKNIDNTILMVIEKDSDLESVHKSKIYSGKYFILGGLVPIVEKNTNRKIRVNELKEKLKNDKNIKEIILGFSLNPQGNHTDLYIRSELKELINTKNIKISSLGRGLSTGTELEYSDNDTLRNALRNRQ